MKQFEKAVNYLSEALTKTESYRDEIATDSALKPLINFNPFVELLRSNIN